jgi:hypothetical protein
VLRKGPSASAGAALAQAADLMPHRKSFIIW